MNNSVDSSLKVFELISGEMILSDSSIREDIYTLEYPMMIVVSAGGKFRLSPYLQLQTIKLDKKFINRYKEAHEDSWFTDKLYLLLEYKIHRLTTRIELLENK